METILTITMNPALDLGATVENVYPDHKLRCGQDRCDPGGGGINVSRAIRRLGGESLALYCCGGQSGQILRGLLDEAGLSHRAIPVEGSTRQNVNILERATNQQYRFVMPGPRLEHEEWRKALEAVAGMSPAPRLVVASGSLPPGVPEDFYALLARVVRDQGGRMILDTSGSALVPAIREGVFLVKPSLRELRVFAMGRVEHEPDQARAARMIVESGRCEAVVVSLGAAGALFATAAGCERLHAPSVTVRSRIGAGDSMVAGIALSLARGEALRDAVRHGVAAGTAAVMNPGTELCHIEDVERLLAQMKPAGNPGA
jgi:6-phosphofructokinase 2